MKKRLIVGVLIIISTFILILYYPIALKINVDEQENKVYKIGVLTLTEERLEKINGMNEGLKQYGLSDDSIEIIIKNSNENIGDLDSLAEELVNEGVDIIITTGTAETIAAKKSTKEEQIPVAFVGVGCTVELGLVEDNISTGCNITGVDSHYVQLSGKRIEFLKKLVPSTDKVLVLYNPYTTPFGPSSEYLYDAAKKFNVKLDIVPVTNQSEVIDILNEKGDNVDSVLLMCSLLFESMVDTIVDITIQKQLPVIGVTNKQVEEGILAFYGSTSYNEGMQVARIVVNLLKGQDPKIIPIESPEKLELHVNVDTARRLGINIESSKMPFVDRFIY